MKSWFHEEQLIWGILALVLAYILYSFFGGGKEWFSAPPSCKWAPPTTTSIPSMGIADFLTKYEYSTSNAAQAECGVDPTCTGVIGLTRTVNVSDGSSQKYHTEARTYWKLTKSSTMISNTDPNLQYIGKISCGGGNAITPECEFSATGQSNSKPKGSTLGGQYQTLLDSEVACSLNPSCKGVFSNPTDGLFYLSSDDSIVSATGYTFYNKVSCPTQIGSNAVSPSKSDEVSKLTEYTKGLAAQLALMNTSGGIPSGVVVVPPVGAPPTDATSTLGSVSGMSGMKGKWEQGPKGSVGDSEKWATPGDSWILKSSLVPCTCTTHSMGCEQHAGGKQSSFAPGDMDGKFQDRVDGSGLEYKTQPQSGLMRPFSQAFVNQGEPIGFLNSFSAFA